MHLDPVPSVAVVGGGWHSRTNLLPALALAGVHVLDLATRDLGRAQAALRLVGATGQAWDDVEAMLASTAAERVMVVAQPADQPALVERALAAGKDVLVEKPLGRSSREALRIADLAELHERRVVVGFMKRYAPAHVRLRALLAGSELGHIRGFHLSFGCDARAFCSDLSDVVQLAAIHQIDLLRFLFGECDEVRAMAHGTGADVALTAAVRFGDTTGSLDLWSTGAFSSESERLEVIGDHGVATVTNMTELRVRTAAQAPRQGWRDLGETEHVHMAAHSAMAGVERDLFLGGFVGQAEDFARTSGRTGPAADARDNVATMHLCERLVDAATHGSPPRH